MARRRLSCSPGNLEFFHFLLESSYESSTSTASSPLIAQRASAAAQSRSTASGRSSKSDCNRCVNGPGATAARIGGGSCEGGSVGSSHSKSSSCHRSPRGTLRPRGSSLICSTALLGRAAIGSGALLLRSGASSLASMCGRPGVGAGPIARPFTSLIGLAGTVVGTSTTEPMGLRNGDRLIGGATVLPVSIAFAGGAGGTGCRRGGAAAVGNGGDFFNKARVLTASAATTPSFVFSASWTSTSTAPGRLGRHGGAVPTRLAA